MKAAGIILILCIAGMVVYFPIAYLDRHATHDRELADVKAKLAEAEKHLLVMQQRADRNERMSADLQDERGKTQELNRTVSQLAAELESAKRAIEQYRFQLAQTNNQAMPRIVPPPADDVSEEMVICPYCGGDYEHQWVTCERSSRGSGCDGKGYRDCFTCLGAGTIRCPSCGGDGQVEVVSRSGGTFQTPQTRTQRCSRCGGTGHIACHKCSTLYVRQPLHRFLDPIISEGKPLATTEFMYCGYRVLVAANYSDWIQVKGSVICPKCDGRGKIKVKGPCPHCKEGKIPLSELPVELRRQL